MADGTISSLYDVLTADGASQEFATAIITPCAVGWLLQILVAGAALGWGTIYAAGPLWASDTRRRRFLLIAVLGLCAMQAGENMYLSIKASTMQTRSAENILRPTVADALQPCGVALTAVLVQTFLAERAIRLLQRRWAKWTAAALFTLIIGVEFVAAFIAVGLDLTYALSAAGVSATPHDFALYSISTATFLVCGAVADSAVTALLCVSLHKRIAGFHEGTDTKLRRLMHLAVVASSYTAVVALAGAVVALASPSDQILLTSVQLPFWYILPSLYPLSLLTAFSSRQVFAADRSTILHPAAVTIFRSPRSPQVIKFNDVHQRRNSFPPKHPLSPVLLPARLMSRYFPSPPQSRRKSPLDLYGVALPEPILVHVEIEERVDSDDDEEEYGVEDGLPSIGYALVKRPALAHTDSGGRGRERDLEAGLLSDEGYEAGIITGQSGRKEAWEA